MKVLVVDDHPFVRRTLGVILSGLGRADIHEAGDGAQALDLLRRYPGEFDLVFCDLMMPGRDGIETLRDLAENARDAAVVLMSGEDGRVLGAAGDLAASHGLRVLGTLAKPVTADQVRDLLARATEPAARQPARREIAVTRADLERGLAAGEIIGHYQPKVALQTRTFVGVEALARWRHPTLGVLPPDSFIPLAESSGLIGTLTDQLLRRSIAQCALWRANGLHLAVSVNFSSYDFTRLELPEEILALARSAGIEPPQLVLEVTESRVAKDPTALLDITARLRLKGFGLSIDDFGTGFSSLAQLKRLPFTELKIDRQFVAGAATDAVARSIVESNVELARKLRLTVAVEGVETREAWDLMAGLGCDLAQGYFIARPMAGEEIDGWAAAWRQRAW
jgi:EAL domain-containing protein (putative c-di-GMP-specific phosphodiesterase class I)/AmiR/NasT family two-component response regulator